MPSLQLAFGSIEAHFPHGPNAGPVDVAASGTADGAYVVAGIFNDDDTLSYHVVAQRFDATGTALGDPIEVQSYPESNPRVDVLGLEGGGFVVAWSTSISEDSGFDVYARIYDATGAPLGATFQVNTTTDSTPVAPSVKSGPDGGFEILWNEGTASQAYTASGTPIGAEMSHPASPPNEEVRSDLPGGAYLLATADGHVEYHAEDGTLLETFQIPLGPASPDTAYDLAAVPGALVSIVNKFMQIIPFQPDGPVSIEEGRVYGGDADDIVSLGHGVINVFGFAGNDTLTAVHEDLVFAKLDGGVGDDTFILELDDGDTGSATGGEGGDLFKRSGGGTTSLLGGVGNDTFVVSGSGSLTINAGVGDDLVQLNALSIVPTIDLGVGHDAVEMQEGSFTTDAGVITVIGFDGGVGGDQLDLYAYLESALIGWDGSTNPFSAGYLRLVQQGSYATIQIDFDGGSDGFVDLVRFVEDATALTENIGFSFGSVLIPGGVIFGTNGNDTNLIGTSGDNVINALDGKDSVNGGGGNDFVQGGAGDDQLSGNAGDDLLQGGDGDDTLRGGAGGDLLDGGAGFDWVRYDSSVAIDLLTGESFGEAVGDRFRSIEGYRLSNAGDDFKGSDADEVIDGGLGADYMVGRGGNDYYYVSQSDDNVVEAAGEGTDTVEAASNYTLSDNIENLKLNGIGAQRGVGNALNNTITGNDINNIIDGAAGADSMSGRAGDDTYFVDNVGDKVFEKDGEGTDRVYAGVSFTLAGQYVEELILTGSGNINGTGNGLANTITGNSGTNALNGGGGDDVLDGGAGADKMTGGIGDDRYVVDNAGDQIIELSDGGYDRVASSVSFALSGYVEALTLTGTANINATGNALSNTLIGNNAKNVLDGGAGSDVMQGAKGDDTYYVDDSAEQVIEIDGSGQGSDTVISSISFNLGSQYVEALILTGSAALNGTGNSLQNKITGNSGANTLNGLAGNDTLDGGAGADTLIGGLGNDTFVVDNAGDSVVELNGEGTDTVESSVSYSIAGRYIEQLKLTGTADINATGNGLDNLLRGNVGNNVLNGGTGADNMAGGLGDDRYIVDNSGDKVIEFGNEGTDTIEASVSVNIATTYVENIILTGSAGIGATGNSADNVIIGNSAANTLLGVKGHDALHGGLGSDTLTGGDGMNHYWFETALGATNVDTITDFRPVDDTIDLDRSIFSGIAADGALAAGAFRLGTASVDADDRILYDKATGNLYYDADGAGGVAAVLFAKVAVNTNLTAADFFGHP